MKTQTLMPVPPHLQDRHYSGAAALGRGLDYKYAHDYPNHYVKQQYLPDGMEGAVFYEPSDNGYEKEIKRGWRFCGEVRSRKERGRKRSQPMNRQILRMVFHSLQRI